MGVNNKLVKISSLIFLAMAGFLSYYAEVLIHGWEGLLWVMNFYWTFLILPFAFCAWIKVFVCKEIKLKALSLFLLSYFLTFIAIYILLNVIYNIRFFVFLIFFYYFRIDAGIFLSVTVFSLAIALVFFVLFLENVKLQSILNFTLSRKEKLALFFMPLYIFFAAEIFMLLCFLLRLFPKMQASDLLDSIFIFKTGTVIFTSVMLEGLYIMHKKSSALN